MNEQQKELSLQTNQPKAEKDYSRYFQRPSITSARKRSREQAHVHRDFAIEQSIKNIGKVEANGMQTADGFVVFKGSLVSLQDDDTIPAVIKERRKSAPLDKQGILQEDMLFTSPSYAAMFVIGKSANGLTSWKTTDGKTLKSLENEN